MLGAAMAWRRGQSYSEDLRARVLAARLFRVSVSYIYKALIRRRRTGEVSASSRRGHRPRKLTPEQETTLAAHIAAIRVSPWRRCKPRWRGRWSPCQAEVSAAFIPQWNERRRGVGAA